MRRTYAVIAKGIPMKRSQGADPKVLANALAKANGAEITRYHVRLPKSPTAPRGALLIEATSVAAAARLCEQGVILEAESFEAEPYTPDI